VVSPEPDLHPLQHFHRQLTADEDERVVIGQPARFASEIDDHLFLTDLLHLGRHQRVDPTTTEELLNLSPVRVPALAESLLAVRDDHLGIALLRKLTGGLQRAVSAANNEDAAPLVLLRVDQGVADLGELLAGNAQFSG